MTDDQVDIGCVTAVECFDHAVWRYDGLVYEHEAFKARAVHKVVFDGQQGVHDQSVLVEVEKVAAVGVLGHSVAHGRQFGPTCWRGWVGEVVIAKFREEGHVA